MDTGVEEVFDMKTIEERAVQYEEISGCYGCELGQVKEAFIAGAKSEHDELTRWNDPECEPKVNTPILLKMESPRNDIIYRTGFFICNYTAYDSNVYYYKVVGWREIPE